MQVHYGNDNVLIRHYPKNDSERKFNRETAANAVFDFVVQEWIDLDSIERVLNGRKKAFPEILLLGLIKLCRRHHLCLGFRMEANWLHPRAA